MLRILRKLNFQNGHRFPIHFLGSNVDSMMYKSTVSRSLAQNSGCWTLSNGRKKGASTNVVQEKSENTRGTEQNVRSKRSTLVQRALSLCTLQSLPGVYITRFFLRGVHVTCFC